MRVIFIVATLTILAFATQARAHQLHTLYNFCSQGGCADGGYPNSGLVMDASGNLFGTTGFGGPGDTGTAFELIANVDGDGWTYKKLYDFCSLPSCTDGSMPYGVVIDTTGNLYGMTEGGGSNKGGMVYELSPGADSGPWTLTVLHNFCPYGSTGCSDGNFPVTQLTYAGEPSGLPYDGVSPLYGVTSGGGVNATNSSITGGVVFSLTKDRGGRWREHVLYSFCAQVNCADGDGPSGGVTLTAQGDLVGTTGYGGENGLGNAFQLAASHGKDTWREKVLYSFCWRARCDWAAYAYFSRLVFDDAGDIFGTTISGGRGENCPRKNGGVGSHHCGLIYKLAPHKPAETTVYDFCSLTDCSDGAYPYSLSADRSGNLLGITKFGGTGRNDQQGLGGGIVFKLNETLSVLYNFCSQSQCADGIFPQAVMSDTAGNLFGMTGEGGAHNGGTVFELTPD